PSASRLPAPASLSGLPGGLFPTHRPGALTAALSGLIVGVSELKLTEQGRLSRHLLPDLGVQGVDYLLPLATGDRQRGVFRSEEHTSELQSRENLVCRLLL